MKKFFVVVDNKFIYEQFTKIFQKKGFLVDYYCSPKSDKIFQEEIKSNKIVPIVLKHNDRHLIDGGYVLGMSCHSKQVFPRELVTSLRCINIHPGFNPYNRGWFPQVFSIINKLPIGVTIHIMDEEIDHGEIIVQEKMEIYSDDRSIDVYKRILNKEIELLERYIDDIISNRYTATQPLQEGNYNSIQDYHNICKIDLTQEVTMKEAIDYLRAMTHPPYENSYFIDENGDKIFISLNLKKNP